MSQAAPPPSPAASDPDGPAARRARPERGPGLNVALFLMTCVTTTFAGGPRYAAGLMAILLTHEMGHYVAARLHRVRASLPYFIPMPLSILGTMGAIIVTRSPFPTRREIFDVGVAGPIAGFVVALPAWIVGLSMSEVVPREAFDVSAAGGFSIEFGESLLTWMTSEWLHPNVGDDHIIVASPLAMAGWVGLILTAINLLPAGSLDGGHISYAFFWRRHRQLSMVTALGMVLLGAQAIEFWPENPAHIGSLPVPIDFEDPRIVWLVWAVLVSLFALNHPPPVNPHVPMTRGRRWVAFATLCIFLLTFVPAPLRIDGPKPGEATHELEPQHDSPSEYDRGPRPGRDPRGRRTLDVRTTPELRLSFRHRPA